MKNVAAILKSTEFFSNIPDEELEKFTAKITLFHFMKDEQIIRKGDEGSAMFIILEGNVKIHDEEYIVAQLGTGSFFGEMSLLDDQLRSMSVTAMDEVELISIQRDVLFNLFRDQPVVAKKIISTITKRLREQDDVLINQLKSREEELTKLVAAKTEGLSKKNEELAEALLQVKTTQEQLIQREKLASLGQLTAGIAHEIKNPLNFINNFSEVSVELLDELKQSQSEEEKQEIILSLQQGLTKINEHGKRADSIVKSMLDHSRGSSAEKQLTDINQLCGEFFNLAYHGMRSNHPDFNCRIDKQLDEQLPKVNVVPQDMSRVMLNLFNNAFFAVHEKMKHNGSANAGGETYHPMVSLITQHSNNNITITVRDNGNGIPAHIREKIFTPFFTTKPTGQGTGLGLSLSYDIVKAQGGEIKVLSKENEFTEFAIIIPVWRS